MTKSMLPTSTRTMHATQRLLESPSATGLSANPPCIVSHIPRLCHRRALNDSLTLFVVSCWSMLIPIATFAQSSHAHSPGETDAYFLVIDHSGSMTDPGRTGAPRWQEMQDHARQLLSQIPLDTDVQAATFSNELSPSRKLPFNSESDRDAAIREVSTMCEQPVGKTRLFDSLGEILERAEQVYRDAPQREVRVMVFTDGLDTSSTRWTQASLQQRFHKLVSDQPNIWLFFTQLQEDQQNVRQVIDHPHAVQHAFKPPILLKTCPRVVRLKDPAIHPRQEIDLEFVGPSPEYWRDLAGQHARAAFDDAGSDLAAEIGPISLSPGTKSVPIQFANNSQLPPGKARPTSLRLDFPQLAGHEIRASNRIAVEFEPPPQPRIFVDSADTPRWRQSVPLRLADAAGAKHVDWLVDGAPPSSGTKPNLETQAGPNSGEPPGRDPTRSRVIFDRVGRSQVAARITWPNDSITIVESPVDVTATPITVQVRAELVTPEWLYGLIGGRYRLIDESTGDIVDRRWLVDDVPLEGEPETLWLKPLQRPSLRFVTTAPTQLSGVPEEVDVLVKLDPVGKVAWLPYLFLVPLAVWAGLRLWPFFFGAHAHNFRLYYSPKRIPLPQAGDSYLDLGRYWRTRQQEAIVPFERMFAPSTYWSQGGGQHERLNVRVRAREEGTDQIFGYTGSGSTYALVTPAFRDEHPGVCCQITDHRCPETEYRKLHFRLVPGNLRRSIPRMLAFVTATLALATVWGTWSLGWWGI